jgi:predicted signal transduction protein with EAL and GGDEF domain
VVGEGVEDESVAGILLGYECDDAQGYLFGRPAAAEQLTELLSSDSCLPASGAAVNGAAFELDGVAATVLAQSLNDSIKAHSDGRAGGS